MDARLFGAIATSNYKKAYKLIEKSWDNSEIDELNRVFTSPSPCHTILDMANMIAADNSGNAEHPSHQIVKVLRVVGAKTYAEIEGQAQYGCHKSTKTCSSHTRSRTRTRARSRAGSRGNSGSSRTRARTSRNKTLKSAY